MRLTIENKQKLEIFVAIFQLLKNWGSHINMHFETNKFSIQSMDKSHVCLSNIEINSKWFSDYDCSTTNKLSVNSTHFAILMNYVLKHDKLELIFDNNEDPDKLFINFLNDKEKTEDNDKKNSSKGGSFNHYFELNLIDIDEDSLGIPNVDYDIEFTIESKKFTELLSELNTFGQDLNIICNEEVVELNASGENTKLKVNIPVDDLDEYAISEGEILNMSFSLSHLCKMCTSMKMSSMINVCLSKEYPMSLTYDLGDNSKVSFYMAPKVND